MPSLRHLLLGCYYGATLPYRRLRNLRDAATGKAPVIVLFYHRVADSHPNGWTISTARFTEHVDYLAAHFEMVSLAEAQARIARGENHRPAAVITFDDGYSENCAHALPLLIKRRIPCTYFVTLQNIVTGKPFPHDVKAGAPLQPNTVDELRALAAAGIDIGGHTRTHPDLGALHDERRLRDETVAPVRELEAMLGQAVRFFAFPYGLPKNLNRRASDMLREAGLAGVCSAYGGYNWPGADPFHLQRIHGDPEMIPLKNWLTVDPRKRSVHHAL